MNKKIIAVFLVSMLIFSMAPIAAHAEADEKLPLKGYKIGIDAGHQAKGNPALEPNAPGSKVKKAKCTSGTSGSYSRLPEYKLNLAVALPLRKKLKALGAEVVMTRTAHKVDISNAERAKLMNKEEVDLCIRIHADGSEKKSIHGASMLVPTKKSNPDIYKESLNAGETILKSFIKKTGAKNRGISKRSDQTGFNWSEVPVCTIEMGFMSNKKEDKLLASKKYQEKCAQGLADGITAWAKSKS